MNKKPVLIGITGGSGSGKTTIADCLAKSYGAERAILICEDDYYKDTSLMPGYDKPGFDFDTPEIRDHRLLLEHIALFKKGIAFEKPIYDFTNHCRSINTQRILPCDIWILEGTHALHNPQIRSQMELKIFVETSEDVRYHRRLRRDVKERGRVEEEVIAQFWSSVRPGHEKWTEPQKQHADLVLSGGNNIAPISEAEMEIAISDIKNYFSRS
jgi:uridine kinase